jgi:hypothetical protein
MKQSRKNRGLLIASFLLCVHPLAAQSLRVVIVPGEPGVETELISTRIESAAHRDAATQALRVSFARIDDLLGRSFPANQPNRMLGMLTGHWPNDWVYVVDLRSADIASEETLAAPILGLAALEPDLRRFEQRRYRGDLRAWFLRSQGSDEKETVGLAPAASSPLASDSIVLRSVSDGRANFYRNGVLFHQASGFGPGRGINVAVVHEGTGEIEEIYAFDTWLYAKEHSDLAAAFVKMIVSGRLVLTAVADANYLSLYPDSVAAFETQLGSTFAKTATLWDTWALIARKGSTPSLSEDWKHHDTTWLSATAEVTWSPQPYEDHTPPQGSIRIESGESTTGSNLVRIDLSGVTDLGSGLVPGGKVKLSNDGQTWSPMEDFAASFGWILARGDGAKTVFAVVRDKAGNWSEPMSASIELHEVSPMRKLPSPSSYSQSRYCVQANLLHQLTDQGIFRSSHDLGVTWSEPVRVFSQGSYGDFQLNTIGASIVLAFRWTSTSEGLTVALNKSDDSGLTWLNAPVEIRVPAAVTDFRATCADAGMVVFSWIAEVDGYDQLFVLASRDAAVTWPDQPTQVTNQTLRTDLYTDDVDLVAHENTILALVSTDSVGIFRSLNGGVSFDPPRQVLPDRPYRARLAISDDGIVYVCSKHDGQSPIVVRRSLDLGITWSLPLLVANASPYDFTLVARGNGVVHVVWTENSAQGDSVRVATSNSNGVSWHLATLHGNVKWTTSRFAQAADVWDQPLVAMNRTGVVAVLWTAKPNSAVIRYSVAAAARSGYEDSSIASRLEVYAAISDDAGSSWEMSGPLNEGCIETTQYRYLRDLLVPDDGTVLSIWNSNADYLDVRHQAHHVRRRLKF